MDESVFIWVESVLHLRTYFPDWNLKLDLINIAHVEFNIGMHCSFIKLPYSLHPVGIEHLHYWVNTDECTHNVIPGLNAERAAQHLST